MKLALILLFLQLPPGDREIRKYQEIDEVFNKAYNHSRLLSADEEAKEMTLALLIKYPNDPYLYDLWTSTEWLLIGRELGLKADEQKNISDKGGYRERAKQYRSMLDKGLSLTENASDERTLFLRAALKFDQAKFSARYESHLSGLKRADQEAAEGVKILKDLLFANPNFCSAYFLIGGNRLQLSTKTNLMEQIFAWKFSKVYSELYLLDRDVFNEKKALEWLEKSYRCGYPQPWLKKNWLETGFLLIKAYQDYGKRLGTKDELGILKKEIPVLKQWETMFPQNQDIKTMLQEREFRLKILENYFSKK